MENPIQYNKNEFAPYIAERFAKTFGLIEANSYERHKLYFELKTQGYDVEQISDGLMTTIGTFHGHPVTLSFSWYKVNDILVGFYSSDSAVVNWDMIKTWIKTNLPHIKANNDAMNSHNTLHPIGVKHTVESLEKSMNYIATEHNYQIEQLQKSFNRIQSTVQI